ncbi:MAG: flagellar assembly protein FliW [FCB group bacterium]|nr:flagellar assembly protein FliW [FCB group bacterium]
MNIMTTRFGELEIDESLTIRMTKPILGFEQLRRYVIVETEDFEPFRWFQSIDDPDVAFVIVNPLLFYPDYLIEVNPKEIEELKVADVADVASYAIVTIPEDYTKMTVNLQGPVLINQSTNLAKQLVLVNSRYRIKHRVMESGKIQRTESSAVPV